MVNWKDWNKDGVKLRHDADIVNMVGDGHMDARFGFRIVHQSSTGLHVYHHYQSGSKAESDLKVIVGLERGVTYHVQQRIGNTNRWEIVRTLRAMPENTMKAIERTGDTKKVWDTQGPF